MTDRIQHIINEIRSKKDKISDLLKIERQKVEARDQQINDLMMQLEGSKKENGSLEAEISTLKNDLKDAQHALDSLKQLNVKETVNVDTETPITGISNVEIDELVREIEYCIGQLKNNA